MSVNIKIQDAVKKYGDHTIISDLSLDIREGEFFTLLGPSGCGKTTLLRMIAGFNSIEGGDFFFNDVRINDMDPAKRNIGMVFQNYAVFPNMTVEKNVAFGLKQRKLPKEEIQQKTQKFLKLMQIDQYADRMPERLSGGQQQRVALARALAITPDVLLMDEPLSNLDAKLRVEMRSVIKEIQHSVGITTVYVTHDQEEAMAVSDRIAVMNHGDIQQVGTPKILYQRPANQFVANFIGRTNMMKAHLAVRDGVPYLQLKAGFEVAMDTIREEEIFDRDVIASIRPEEMVVDPSNDGKGVEAVVDDAVFLGLNTTYFVHFMDGEKAVIIQESSIDSMIEKGTDVHLMLKTEKLNLFNEDGSRSLMKGVVNDLDLLKKGE
ncbi:MAG: ABC transporter ATP-binding protein [Galactobacillus timonensis]|uniref:ABC transporter ATP-binding protein n=1 Tax=Galactobacillus timonensis TaxID=2041840 RepID=UPI0023EFB4F7|nr:ABC transporter ATP-binding protein [Galactobacillus timonensis]MCI6068250.1 ABC transporter ATP-binding protein [Galactobacillus timonensis]MCI6754607.1 ABC transporter ATP-binding protein [Galactobacillus timonensis]MDD6679913.1 ABC transporter ATP-binding protein [Galactobacillus timonensis]